MTYQCCMTDESEFCHPRGVPDLESCHSAHLELLTAHQVGRPHDGQVFGRHARAVVVGGDPGQVTDQKLQRSGTRRDGQARKYTH